MTCIHLVTYMVADVRFKLSPYAILLENTHIHPLASKYVLQPLAGPCSMNARYFAAISAEQLHLPWDASARLVALARRAHGGALCRILQQVNLSVHLSVYQQVAPMVHTLKW